MKPRLFFITSTDTGAGKTVLTAHLAHHLREHGVAVAALKPVSSGNRDDARQLRAALGHALTLDEINPWHFRAALAPLLAARRERRRVRLASVVHHIRVVARRSGVTLIEGAGGLLSPLGEDFNSRDLINSLGAAPIVVCPNRLGCVNQVLLVMSALPPGSARRARVVLVAQAQPDVSCRSNFALLREQLKTTPLHELPWLGPSPFPRRDPQAERTANLATSLVDLP